MTHEIDLLTVKSKFDRSGFDEMEKAAAEAVASVKEEAKSLSRQKVTLDTSMITAITKNVAEGFAEIKKEVDDLSKKKPKIDTSKLLTDLKKAEAAVLELSKERVIKLAAPDSAQLQAELKKIDEQISSIMHNSVVQVGGTFGLKDSLLGIQSDIRDLDKEIDALTKERELHIKFAQSGDAVSERKIKDLDDKIDKATRLRELKITVQKGMTKEMEEALNGLTSKLKTATIAATAFSAAFGATTYLISDYLDHIGKESQKLNLTTKTFQELSHIAGQSGTSVEGLSMAMRTLTMKAVEGDAAFKSIGVNIKDANGHLKDQETLFNEVIAKLQGMEAGTNRSALAFTLLGRSAAELEPLLNAGAGAMEDLRREANEFGLVLDSKTVKAGEDLNDALGLMTSASKNLFVAGLSPLVPVLTESAAGMAKFAAEMQPVAKEYIRDLIDGFTKLEAPMTTTGYVLIGLASGLGAYAIASVAATVQTGVLTAAVRALTTAMMANPFIALATIIAAVLIPAIVALWKNWDVFVAHFQHGCTLMREYASMAAIGITTFFKNAWDTVKAGFNTMLAGVMEGVASTLEMMDWVTGGMSETLAGWAKDARETASELEGVTDNLMKGIELREREAETSKFASREIIAQSEDRLDATLAEIEALKERNKLQGEGGDTEAPPKIQAPAAPKSGGSGGSKDRLKELEADYKAQKQIAEALIRDEQRLADALLSIDARYYADKEKILRENYSKQVAAGKAITAEQMQQLEDVAAKARETARESGLREIEASYRARVDLARQVAGEESSIEAAGFEEKKKFLEEKLALLVSGAEESIRQTGRVEAAEIEAIRRTKDEIVQAQLGGIKESYDTRVAIANATITKEMDLEKELLTAKKDMLQQQLDAMLAAAAQQMALNGSISDKAIEDIKRVREELKNVGKDLEEKPLVEQLQSVAQSFGQYLSGMVDQLSSYFSQQFDDAIKSAERQYKQMSKMLDLQYKEQLKELEKVEKEKADLTDKYEGRRADILEQMQETMTEEEYLGLQQQLEDEQLKYEESMLALEEDNLTREELEAQHLAAMELLQKEHAEKMAQLESKKAAFEKIAGITKAIISTAVGVANALASVPYPLNIAAAAMTAAIGAVQIATIASQSPPAPPSFFTGGDVGGGNAHLYTMVPPAPDPRDNTLIWAAEGERVLNHGESELYRSLLAAGFTLHDALYAVQGAGNSAAGTVVDNSRRVVQHNSFEVKESMSWCESRRYARKMQRLGWGLA